MKVASCFLLLVLSRTLAFAGDLSGKYSFSIQPVSGEMQQGLLTLDEQGETISGSIALTAGGHPVPIKRVQRQGDLLTFDASDKPGHRMKFQLKLGLAGFRGEARSESQRFEIIQSHPDGYYVGPGITPPILTYRVEPEYTEEARKSNCKGTVLLYVQISRDGSAINPRVLHSLGCGLDEKAMAAVTQWRFAAALKDGNRITIEAKVPFDFHP